MSSEAHEGGAHPRDELKRELSLFDAAMLVVASVIGAGIFFTPGQVADLLPSPGWILVAWGTGALLSWAGALANAELAAMYPHAGGDYVYLREAFHPLAGFLVGWLSFFAIYAGTIATLSVILGEGVARLLGWGASGALTVAVAVTVGLSALNHLGVRMGATANNLTSLIKIAALLLLVAVGPLMGPGEAGRIFDGFFSLGAGADAITPISFGRALSPILFSYLGWNAAVYVASEIRNPGRSVPGALFLGLAVCAALYMGVNGVYLYALPMSELRGVADAGAAASSVLFGAAGGHLVAIFVLISVLGTLNATVLVGPRIAYAMALDGLFFRGVDAVHVRFRTPTIAIWVQAGVTVVLLGLLRTFPKALDFTVFAIVLATIADVLALYRLRRVRADRPRPYRAWGYPWTPGLYLLANLAIAVSMMVGSPFECAIGVALLALGAPFYALFSRSLEGTGSGC